MKFSIKSLTFFLLFFSSLIYGDDTREKLKEIFSEYPSVQIKVDRNLSADLIKPEKVLLSEIIETIDIESLRVNRDQIEHLGKIMKLKLQKISKGRFSINNRNNLKAYWRVKKLLCYWKFDLPDAGDYYCLQESRLGMEGLFDSTRKVFVHKAGLVSLKDHHQLFLYLKKGNHSLLLGKYSQSNTNLIFIKKTVLIESRSKFVERIFSEKKDDIQWVLKQLLPSIASASIEPTVHLQLVLDLPHIKKYIEKNKESVAKTLAKIMTNMSYRDQYLFNYYLYENITELYFTKFIGRNKKPYYLFNPSTIYHRVYNLLTYFVKNNEFDKSDAFIKRVLTVFEKEKDRKKFDLIKATIYARYWIALCRAGEVRRAKTIQKKHNDLFKGYKPSTNRVFKIYFDMVYYMGSGHKEAKTLVIDDATYENDALKTRTLLQSYDGDEASLKKAFQIYRMLPEKLITNKNNFYSLKFNFKIHGNANKKFKKDFNDLCQLKLKNKLAKLISSGSVLSKESFLKQFSFAIGTSELRYSLFKDYYSKGSLLKALSTGRMLLKEKSSMSSLILPKVKSLEEFCDIPTGLQVSVSAKFHDQQFKKRGVITSYKMHGSARERLPLEKGLGHLISKIALKRSHRQYWDHPTLGFHQGTEPSFSSSKLFLPGSSYLNVFGLSSNKLIENKNEKNEFFNREERGAHQKHFIARPLGDNILFLSNRTNSVKKTLRCFSSDGEIVWDLLDENDGSEVDPIAMPIEAGGFLYLFSYVGSSTIKSISVNIVDPDNGKILRTTPLANIEKNIFNNGGRVVFSNWNTYRHDDHFVKDDQAVYGFTGTGILVKINTNSQEIEWGKTFNSVRSFKKFDDHVISAPSGFIQLFGNTIVAFTPGVQAYVGINKNSGETLWRSHFYHPEFIHGRNQSKSIYFTSHLINEIASITRLDPLTGKTIWKKSLNGVRIVGEGDLVRGHLYLPCEDGIAVFKANDGQFIKSIPMSNKPLKVRFRNGYWVIITKSDAFLLADDGAWSAKTLSDTVKARTENIQKDFDHKVNPLPYEEISLEKSIYVPELNYTQKDLLLSTSVLKTSNPFYHVMKSDKHLSLFREGFSRKNGQMISPKLIWYESLPNHFLYKDKIVISEPGEIKCQDIISRKTIWRYQYVPSEALAKERLAKTISLVSGSDKYVVFHSRQGILTILDKNSGKRLYDFECRGVKALAIYDEMVMTYNGSKIAGYDLNKKGALVWENKYHYTVIFNTYSKGFVVHKPNRRLIELLDAKTGRLIAGLPHSKFMYGKYKGMHESEKYFSIMNLLYDKQTNKLIKKYAEVYPIGKGSYFCFLKPYGNVGVYLSGNNTYPFKLSNLRQSYNANMSVIKRGNKIGVFSLMYFETLEIKDDRLVSVDVTAFSGGRTQSFHSASVLFSLTNSLLRLNDNQMSFFRNFDPFRKYKRIKTFRVLNPKKLNWPFDEFYPEIKANLNNWISDDGSQPKRELSYQVGSDQDYVYMRFKLSAISDKTFSHKLLISSNATIGDGIFTWEPDLWSHASVCHSFRKRVVSWKDEHSDGTVYLNLKINLKETYNKTFFNMIPEFSIELRQYKNGIEDGCFRFGGAFVEDQKFFKWVDRNNDESQAIKNFKLRSRIYQEVNFYPQGLELLKWISDRRKFYSVEDNIEFLKNMLKRNNEYICSVNILSVLLQEEIQLFRKNNPVVLDTSAEFKKRLQKLIKDCNEYAISVGVSGDLRKLALTLWCFDVYPKKTVAQYSNPMVIERNELIGNYGLTIFSHHINYSNPMKSRVDTPYMEMISPGLFSTQLKAHVVFARISLVFMPHNLNCGEFAEYGIEGQKILVDQKGRYKSNCKFSIKPVNPGGKNNFYHFRSKSVAANKKRTWLTITLGKKKFEIQKKLSPMTYESALSILSNLPSDSHLGYYVISSIGGLNAKISLDQRLELYVSWLKRVKQSFATASNRGRHLLNLLPASVDRNFFIKKICRDARVQRNIQRYYYMHYNNLISTISKRSVLGPFSKDLVADPEKNLNAKTVYSDKNISMKFGDNFKSSKGVFGYIAIKIFADKPQKAYVHSIASKYGGRAMLTIWLNKKELLSKNYMESKDKMISQKLRLKRGENILLIKIDNQKLWKKTSFIVGDKNGAPVKGLTFSGIH